MGAFKLGKMTFGSLFKKPETVLYPYKTKPQPSGLKGHIRIDAEACILCGMCERSCTTGCLTVSKVERFWQIDAFGCVQCGYCTTVCPKKCLYMEPDYHPAATQMAPDRIAIPEQAKRTAKPTATPAAALDPDPKPAAMPEPVVVPRSVAADPTATPDSAASDLPAQLDAQVESLIALMDANASDKVRAALAK